MANRGRAPGVERLYAQRERKSRRGAEQHACGRGGVATFMPMMPPDTDLKKHLRCLRSLGEARAAYLASARNREAVLQTKQAIDQIIAMSDPVEERGWRRVLALVRAAMRKQRR